MSEGAEDFHERRKSRWRVQEIGVLAMLVAQLVGLIWGAATLKAGVDNMGTLVAKLDTAVQSVDLQQRRLEIEQARQSGRIDAIQGMVVEIQRQRIR